MDLLQFYSSEDSDEDNEKIESSCVSQTDNVDYFNLGGDKSDKETNVHGTKSILDDYELMKTSKILSERTYGPSKPPKLSNFAESESNLKFSNTKRVSSTNSTDFTFHASKKQRIIACDFPQVTSDAENVKTDSFPNISSINPWSAHAEAEKTFHSEKDCMISAEEIFCSNQKISYYASQNTSCKIPKHHKSYVLHKSCITSLNWCTQRYSHLLLTSSMDSTVNIWDMFLTKTVSRINADGAVKSAKWSLCGTKVIYGGFGKTANVTDLRTGQNVFSSSFEDVVSSLEIHPSMDAVFLAGTKNNIFAFDTRRSESQPIKQYSSKCQQVLDIAFINDGKEFVCSTDIVSHDCADRTLMVWDFASTAILSNQIYAECYTCPCIRVHPDGLYFIAQSNGDYIAMFSTTRPYKRRNRRYCGHKVSGYNIGCDFSPDGKYIVSGDAEGGLYVYFTEPCSVAKELKVKDEVPTVQVKWHPVMYSTVATASFDGSIQIWR